MDNLFPEPPGETSFVALGDSFTEGLNDTAPEGGYRGWADRLAGMLAIGYPGLKYANLAVQGKVLREIVTEQVPAAVAMSPGLVSIAAGGNDILRPGADPDALAELFDGGIARLRAAGCHVLMFTGGDPAGLPVIRLLRGRIAAYNMNLRAIADARGCSLVDLWSMRFLRDPAAWAPDRIHMTAQSHQRVALRACEVLGVPVTEDWRAAPELVGAGAGARAGAGALAGAATGGTGSTAGTGGPATISTARWAREYLAPWVNRRLHGAIADRTAKRPLLQPVSPPVVT